MQALDNNKTSRWVSWHERDQSASIHYVDGSEFIEPFFFFFLYIVN